MKKEVFSKEEQAALKAWTEYYPYPMMGLLEAMRQVQSWHLCIRPEDEEYIAKLFKTTSSHVHTLTTFFPFFTQKPTGKKRIGVCQGISCTLGGAEKIAHCLEKKLGVPEFQTTADGEFSWERMECIGACDHAPAWLINEDLQGKADSEAVEVLKK